MTLYAVAMGLLSLFALWYTWDLHRMRRAAGDLLREAREHMAQTLKDRIEAERLLADAYAVHEAAVAYSRDAVRRWLRVVSTETRVH